MNSRGGHDTLIGEGADTTTWTITNPTLGDGSAAETTNGTTTTEITFTGIQTLIAGQGNPGNNTITDSSAATWGITGVQIGTIAASLSTQAITFVGFQVITASGSPSDVLYGSDPGTTWALQSDGSWLIDGVTVTGISHFHGSGQSGVNGNTVIGAGAAATWTISPTEGVTLVTPSLGAYTFTGVATIESGASGDTLSGPGAGDSTWTIDGNGSGSLLPSGQTEALNFIAFATLTGSGTDTLLAPGWTGGSGGSGTVAGAAFTGMSTITYNQPTDFYYYGVTDGESIAISTVSGGSNQIALQITDSAGPFALTQFTDPSNQLIVELGSDHSTVTLSSIDSTALAVNATGTHDTLAGPTSPTTFYSDGAGDGTIGGSTHTYSGFASLQGNSGNDTLVGPNATVVQPQSLFAPGSTDTSDNSANPVAWTVTGPNAGTLGTVAFTGFDLLDGTSGLDTLTGPAGTITWNVTSGPGGTGTGTGTVDGVNFEGMATVVGGGAAPDARGADRRRRFHADRQRQRFGQQPQLHQLPGPGRPRDR